MPHTPIDHLLPTPADDAAVVPVATSPTSTVSYGKETAPVTITPEAAPAEEVGQEEESQGEVGKESSEKKKNPKIRLPGESPSIDPDAAKAGLKVAPAASAFPSVYDVKVPILTDEEIVKDLKTSPLTGTRWLAELGRYILRQAHITLKNIGGKIVRERHTDDPSLITKIKRIFWV